MNTINLQWLRLGLGLALSAILSSALAQKAPLPQAVQSLPALAADLQQVSVSGISSGAYLAHQLHVAYSDRIRGAGLVAGGPFGCAAGNTCQAITRCMGAGTPPATKVLWDKASGLEALGKIAPLSHLKQSRVYIARGGQDDTVGEAQTEGLLQFYQQAALPPSDLFIACRQGKGCSLAGHALVTPNGPRACSQHAHPYLNHCGDENQPDEILRWVYPQKNPWNPPNHRLSGRLIAFDQDRATTINTRVYQLAKVGYLYVPAICEQQSCPVHIALHGCAQSEAVLRTNDAFINASQSAGQLYENNSFVRDSGYNASADANGIVILYPQAEPSGYRIIERPIFPSSKESLLNACATLSAAASPSIFGFNPKGCWDWWGYTRQAYMGADNLYLTRKAEQMKAIIEMLDQLGRPRSGRI
jgi:poly(3-hydroxybutyrate) depolymerase